MNPIKQYLVDLITIYRLGRLVYQDDYFQKSAELSAFENLKSPRRTDIINYFVKLIDAKNYLEVGVRNPDKNFNRISCENKFSVDPGVEFEDNPVDFKMTSDTFFETLKGNLLSIKSDTKFDIIFIDGLHLADQAEKDIMNSLDFLNEQGVLILHDCNPPTEFHQRETYEFTMSPARSFWNGTTWKAFYNTRHRSDLYSICFDCDWGVAVISKYPYPLFNHIDDEVQNKFYEFSVLELFRKEHLNLFSFEKWTKLIDK